MCVCSCVSELQTIVDGLLTDKLLLEQQIENLTKEGAELRQQVCVCVCVCLRVFLFQVFLFSFAQLVLQVEEKEAVMIEMNKQSRNMSKIKRGEPNRTCTTPQTQ